MMGKIKIDGDIVEITRDGNSRNGFETVAVWGKDINGRTAVIGRYNVPVDFLDHGGKCFTGGHTYETVRG